MNNEKQPIEYKTGWGYIAIIVFVALAALSFIGDGWKKAVEEAEFTPFEIAYAGGMSAESIGEAVTPDTPVWGFIGGGHDNGIVPPNTPFSSPEHSSCLYGCSYKGLGDAVESVYGKSISVVNVAQATTLSTDVPGTGLKGVEWQFEEVLTQSGWYDGSRLTALTIGFFGDCGLKPCETQQEFDDYFQRVKAVAQRAVEMNIPVCIEAFPDYDDINFRLLNKTLFNNQGFVLSKKYYNNLKNGWHNAFKDMPGVKLVSVWKDMETLDGWHPTNSAAEKAAKILMQECTTGK